MTNAASFFPSLIIADTTYEFLHLEPFTMRFDSKSAKKKLRVNVRFSNHCFSHSPVDGVPYSNEFKLHDHNGKDRIFCPIRFRLSQDLPKIVLSLNNPQCKVYQTAARRNFNYSLEIEDPRGPYHLFFEVSKTTGKAAGMQDLSLFLESAYPEDAERGKPDLLGRIGFHTLCTNVFLRKPVATKR